MLVYVVGGVAGETIVKYLLVYGDKCFGEKQRAEDAWRKLDLFF